MHVGRLQGVLESIRMEYSKYSILEEIESLRDELGHVVNSPSSENSNDFKSQYEKIQMVLCECPSNKFSPTQRMIANEIGATKFIGVGLKNRITNIVESNNVTPSSALNEIAKVRENVGGYIESIEAIYYELDRIGLSPKYLKAGEFEGGVSIPRESINSTLEDLSKEFLKVDTFVKTIKEIVGDDPTSPSVTTITSSEWQVFFEFLPEAAACTALAIERIVALYKNHLEIKKLKQGMEEKNLPESITKPMQEYIDSVVEKKLKDISDEVVNEFYKNNDEGRKNELKIKLSRSLKYVARRIDHGTTFQIDAGIPVRPKAKDESEKIDPEELRVYESTLKYATYVKQMSVEISELERLETPALMIAEHLESDNEEIDKNSNN